MKKYVGLAGILLGLLSSVYARAFEENRGQFPGSVRFAARSAGSLTFIESRALHILDRRNGLRLEFAGSNPHAVVEGETQEPGQVHYLPGVLGKGKETVHAPTYRRVRTRNLYAGVDLVVYFQGSHVEFDFELAPGANLAQVRLLITGPSSWNLDGEGAIQLGGIRVLAPIAYQRSAGGRDPVSARFVRQGDTVRVAAASYDAARPLIVDPVISFFRYVGSEGDDYLPVLATDSQGNAYIGGTLRSVQNSVGAGTTLVSGTADLFVAKYDPAGRMLYTTVIASEGNADHINTIGGLAVDSAGQLAVAGSIYSTSNLPLRAPAQDRPRGNFEGFVMKLNAQGSDLIFSTYLGAGNQDFINAICLSPSGEVLVSGMTYSGAFPLSEGATNPFLRNIDVFLTKYSPAGAVVFSTFLGGYLPFSYDNPQAYSLRQATGLATDASGNIYMTGQITNESLPVKNAFQRQQRGSSDGFILKLDPSAKNILYASYLGGMRVERPRAIAVDRQGNAVVVGLTESDDFPTYLPIQASRSITVDPQGSFVTKVGPDGELLFSTYLGGSGMTSVESVAFDAAGNIALSGFTRSSDFPLQGALRSQVQEADAFYTRLSADGSRVLFSTLMGGSKQDLFGRVVVAPNGDAILAYQSQSRDITPSIAGVSIPGGENFVLLRFSASVTASPAQLSLSNASPSQVFRITASAGQLFDAIASTEAGGEWLQVTPRTGTTAAATSLTATVNAAVAGRLAAGTYRGAIVVTTGEGGQVRIPVTLSAGASVTVSPASLTFTASAGSASLLVNTVQVTAGGAAATLAVSVAAGNGGSWLSATPAQLTTPGALSVSVNTANLAPGTYSGAVTLREGGVVAATVPVTVTVVAAANPPSITANANGGDVDVAFALGAGVAWTATVDQPWVSLLTAAAGSGPGSVRVRIAANTAAASRSAALRIGTLTVPIIQAGPLRLASATSGISLRLNRDLSQPLEARFTVEAGGNPWPLSVSTSDPWLTISPANPSAGENITVRAVPAGLADGAYTGTITVQSAAATNVLTIPVVLTVAASAPLITRAGIVNAASLEAAAIAPNAIYSLFGTGLQCASLPVVQLSGANASVLAVTPNQVNFAVPPALASGPVLVSYRCAGSESAVLSFDTATLAPALFTFLGTGKGNAASINEDGSFNGSAAGFAPAQPGRVVQLFGTGFGVYRAPDMDGLTRITDPVRVQVGGVEAQVLFAGQAPGSTNGLQQVNILLSPSTPAGGAVPLVVEVGGVKAQAGLTLTIGDVR
ncbi:MAG TPA: hypothetical protein VFQ91_19915 [Bryobacteraceae bacterium]|nr:hypothetical protein [Bryobacteraceae bacterium]